MEAPMVWRTPHPLLHVQVSFEATRLSPQHLIDAYSRLVPIRRTALQTTEVTRTTPVTAIRSRRGDEHV
jgi:hypothetical protein